MAGKFSIIGNFAMVLQGSEDDANKLLEFVDENTDMTVIYQKSSDKKLYIKEEEAK